MMVARSIAPRQLPESLQTTFQWNCLIAQKAQQDPQAALPLYKSMKAQSVPPNNHTFPSILKASASLQDPLQPLQLHAHLTRLGLLHSHRHASAALIDAYGKCKLREHALHLFDEIPRQDLDPFIWTALISSLSSNGLTARAFKIYGLMRRSDDPECKVGDAATLAALVSASGSLLCSRMIHALVVRIGLESNIRLANTIVHMYAKLEAIDDALKGFEFIPVDLRDVVSWNTVISGLTMNEKNEAAVSVFDAMMAAGAEPNRVTLISVMKSCAQLCCGETSQRIHDYAAAYHFLRPDDVVVMTALVDMHSRCGDLDRAYQIFERIIGKNTVCWSAMIAGYEQASRPDEALVLFRRMLEGGEDMKPNAVTMISVIAAYSALGASQPAGAVHKYAMVTGLDSDSRVLSSLIDMYAKCGDIELARKVFTGTKYTEKTVVSWTAMIGAEGLHGEGRRANFLFSEMQVQGFQPNEVTFVAVLSACSHSGLVKEGMSLFKGMEKDHGVTPNARHHACVVDLLGRAGLLDEAYNLICEMPIKADLAVWGCLLGACHLHRNSELGEIVEKRILSMNPWSVGHRVLLANMYGSAGRWDDAIRMRVELRKNKLRKVAGRSFIETGN